MKRHLPILTKFVFILSLGLIIIGSSYSFIKKHTIESVADAMYHIGENIKQQPKEIETLPYDIQQLNDKKEVIWKTKNAKPLPSHAKELKILQKKTNYGFDMRTSQQVPYLYVALKNKDGYLEISQPMTLYLNPLKQFYSYVLISYLLISFLMMVSIIWYRHHRYQKEQEVTNFIDQLTQTPSETHALMIQGQSPIYQSLNTLSETLSQRFISVSESEKQFKNLLYDFPVGIFLIDEKQQITFLNRQAKSLLQVDISFPKSYLEIIRHPKLLKAIKKVVHKQKLETLELHTTQPSEHILSVTLRPVSQDTHPMIVGTLYDLTETRKLEIMQQDFVSNVSHELKTPITSIIGFIETLLSGALDDKETAETFLHIMEKDAQRLKQLIQEIILLSKNGQELSDSDLTPISPRQIIEKLLAQYQTMIDKKHLLVKTYFDDDFTFQTHLYYFEPIVKNLIENAVIYNKEGGKLEIQLLKKETEFSIIIMDTGIGMASTDLNRIFERFYRIDKARSRNLGGTGLGLSIVKHYTEILEGQVTVESQLGVGTTFTLTFNR